MSLTLNIRLGSESAIPVEVDESDNVCQVKRKICDKKNLDPRTSHLKILFQGKELSDSCSLKDSDLSDFSVLHAFVLSNDQHQATSRASAAVDHGTAGVGAEKISDDVHEDADQPTSLLYSGSSHSASGVTMVTVMFYVYCKSPCQSIQPGRLRVRCAMCKQASLQLNREPTGWTDVLRSGQIHGHCLNAGCPGDVAEFYFKCNGHRCEDEDSSVVLHQVVANIHEHVCLTCSDLISPVLVFDCDNAHVMCLPCFEEYCRTRLSERAFVYSSEHGYTLGCPAGCENSLIQEAHHFKVLGKDQYDRYQRFATEECLIRDGGVLCPAPGCGEGLFPGDVRRVQCVREGCMFVFCKECHAEYHNGACNLAAANGSDVDSTSSRQFVRLRSEDCASLQTIATTTKPCPRCKVPVEKTGGCMHMVCSRCDFEWCWLCCEAWTRDCMGAHWFG